MAKTQYAKAADEVTIDRRSDDRRNDEDRRKEDKPVAVDNRKGQRRAVTRRRQIDPTTCERDYTNDEIEFMQAMDAYKRSSGRMFPTCSEILEVVRGLGYERTSPQVDSAAVETPVESSETLPEGDLVAGQTSGVAEEEDLENNLLQDSDEF